MSFLGATIGILFAATVVLVMAVIKNTRKFRIVTKDGHYKVQRRGLLFWSDATKYPYQISLNLAREIMQNKEREMNLRSKRGWAEPKQQ